MMDYVGVSLWSKLSLSLSLALFFYSVETFILLLFCLSTVCQVTENLYKISWERGRSLKLAQAVQE